MDVGVVGARERVDMGKGWHGEVPVLLTCNRIRESKGTSRRVAAQAPPFWLLYLVTVARPRLEYRGLKLFRESRSVVQLRRDIHLAPRE